MAVHACIFAVIKKSPASEIEAGLFLFAVQSVLVAVMPVMTMMAMMAAVMVMTKAAAVPEAAAVRPTVSTVAVSRIPTGTEIDAHSGARVAVTITAVIRRGIAAVIR